MLKMTTETAAEANSRVPSRAARAGKESDIISRFTSWIWLDGNCSLLQLQIAKTN